MTTTQQPPIGGDPLTLEAKLLLAFKEAAQVSAIFSAPVSQAISLGVTAEPIIKTLAQMFINIFHHHTGVAPTQ